MVPLPEILGVAEVARLLGVSRATVSSYLSRGQMPDPWVRLEAGPVWKWKAIAEWRPEVTDDWREQAERKVDDFERRYEKLVQAVMDARQDLDDCKGLTAGRNIKRGKLAKRFGAVEARRSVPTLKDELRALAEKEVAAVLLDHGDDPGIAALARQLAEAEALKAKLQRRADRELFAHA